MYWNGIVEVSAKEIPYGARLAQPTDSVCNRCNRDCHDGDAENEFSQFCHFCSRRRH
jgi:hypothetical protein